MNIVNECRDRFGGLSERNRALIHAALDGADDKVWNQASRIVVSPMPLMTLGMAVKSVTPRPDVNPPDPFTVYRALRYAVDLRHDYLNRYFDTDFDL